jgi:hypothetical protein
MSIVHGSWNSSSDIPARTGRASAAFLSKRARSASTDSKVGEV